MKEQNHIYHSLWKSIMSFSPVVIIGTIYCIECISSEGFYHPDEHFQIVEFAKWKMGESTPSSMAWELPAHIRPSLQPCLCMLMLYMCHICGLDNPFVQANVLRALSMLLSVTAMTMFYRGNKTLSEMNTEVCIFLCLSCYGFYPLSMCVFHQKRCQVRFY